MHDLPLDKDPRWLVLDPECCWRNKTPCAVRQISLGNKNEKWKKTLVKDVTTLSSEQPNELWAIGNLDHPYWGWDRRRAPRTFSLQRERKTQNSIKQQNKNEKNSDRSIRKIMMLMQITMHVAVLQQILLNNKIRVRNDEPRIDRWKTNYTARGFSWSPFRSMRAKGAASEFAIGDGLIFR